APEHREARMFAPVRAAEEQELRVPTRVALLEQPRLDFVREAARCEGIMPPEATVLDQDPVVDSAGCGSQRLCVLERDLGAERRTTLGHPTPARARPRRSPGPFRPALLPARTA